MKAAYDRCSNYRHYRAAELEEHVWQEVRGLLRDPERLRAGMDAVIETHRSALRGAPEWEEKAWLDKLAEVDSKRVRYQEMVAEELNALDELRENLAGLAEIRTAAEKALENVRDELTALSSSSATGTLYSQATKRLHSRSSTT
jgi:hypothetical protein